MAQAEQKQPKPSKLPEQASKSEDGKTGAQLIVDEREGGW